MKTFRIQTTPIPAFTSAGICHAGKGYVHVSRTLPRPEIFVVEQGILYMEANGYRSKVEQGEVLFHPAGVRQKGFDESPGKLKFVWIHFHTPAQEVSISDHISAQVQEQLSGRSAKDTPPDKSLIIPMHSKPIDFSDLLRTAYDLLERTGRFPVERSVLVCRILARISAEFFAAQLLQPRSRQARLVEQVKYFIRKNMGEPVTAIHIARFLGMNPDYVNRAFKRQTGLTLSDFIVQRKVDHAKYLLADGKSVKLAATQTGFEDPKYFSKRFKKLTGLSPTEYIQVSGDIYRNF